MHEAPFSTASLGLDTERETERIGEFLRGQLRSLGRKGAVVAISGGIDSSVVAALAVRALGTKRVFGLLLPEQDSSETTKDLGRRVVEELGIEYEETEISPLLKAAGCYEKRDAAIRNCLPEYGADWKSKIVLPPHGEKQSYRIFSLVAEAPDGTEHRVRMPLSSYLGVVAATNFKQRCRKMLEYYHADRLSYAVLGTPNRLEYDQGFFVKGGDGLADIKPIAHLYKTQVYALGKTLGLPSEICERTPTTDTYSLPQTQEEFYFSLPYEQMDLALYARDRGIAADEAAAALGLGTAEIEHVYRDIDSKRKVARYLHAQGLTLQAEP